jgi:hypothetical protein
MNMCETVCLCVLVIEVIRPEWVVSDCKGLIDWGAVGYSWPIFHVNNGSIKVLIIRFIILVIRMYVVEYSHRKRK